MAYRVGVFGGTFDPIHTQHLLTAQAAVHLLGLDAMLLVPVGEPSHRDPTAISPANHRYAMVVHAVSDQDRLEASPMDVVRPGPTYTIDTMRDLARNYEPDTRFYLLVGADNLAQLRDWHHADELLSLVHVVGAARWGFPLTDPGLPAGTLTLLHVPTANVSGTRIRRRIALGLPTGHLLPRAVVRYIHRHGLYLTNAGCRPRQAIADGCGVITQPGIREQVSVGGRSSMQG